MLYCLLLLFVLVAACKQPIQKAYDCPPFRDSLERLVFIGERISVERNDEQDTMDATFTARYKIIEKVCGDYEDDTVDFTIYDHSGFLAFSNSQKVMLFLVKNSGSYYHGKYLYYPMYRTKENRWASAFPVFKYLPEDSLLYPFRPERISFSDTVSYDVTGLKKRQILTRYPPPYYRISGNRAYPVYGFHVQELLQLNYINYLNSRRDMDSLVPLEIVLTMFDEVELSTEERKGLKNAWSEFVHGIQTKNATGLKRMSNDSVSCAVCEGFSSPHFYNDQEPIDTFAFHAFASFPGSAVWKQMKAGKYKISAVQDFDDSDNGTKPKPIEGSTRYTIALQTTEDFDAGTYDVQHYFRFVKHQGQFKFVGMESSGTNYKPKK